MSAFVILKLVVYMIHVIGRGLVPLATSEAQPTNNVVPNIASRVTEIIRFIASFFLSVYIHMRVITSAMPPSLV